MTPRYCRPDLFAEGVELIDSAGADAYTAVRSTRGHSHWKNPGKYLKPLIETAREFLTPNTEILDVGCGHGQLASLLPKIKSYTGVDCNHHFLDRARQLHPECVFTTELAERLPWPDKFFDITFCADVLVHVPEPEVVIRELARVTRRVVFCRVRTGNPTYKPNKVCYDPHLGRLVMRGGGGWVLYNVFDSQDFNRLTEVAGALEYGLQGYRAPESKRIGKTIFWFRTDESG